MSIFDVFLIGIALSMDAFAVSVCRGLAMRRLRVGVAAVIGAWFGGFQALMPLIGFFLGRSFEGYIRSFDHWITFALLAFLGVKMIVETLREKGDGERDDDSVSFTALFPLAVATSIDALAVGVTFAFNAVNIWTAIAVIGVITFLLCFVGVGIGAAFGSRFKRPAEIAGGVILLFLGIKILFEHLLTHT